MALDPALQSQMDPQVWEALVEMDARIEALAAGVPAQTVKPDTITETYPDGTTVTYLRQP